MTTQRIRSGAIGGLVGGLVFGSIMGMMGMLPMIGSMVGLPTATAGLIIHLVISVMFGVTYSVLAGRLFSTWKSGLLAGMVYGVIWWVLGPLTMMPLMMGKGLAVAWNVEAASRALPSLMGHLIYGAFLGFVRARLATGVLIMKLSNAHARQEIEPDTISSQTS